MHYETPVPFGQDRLIPIWVATLAVQQKAQTIHFHSAAQLLEFFRLPKDGPHYRRLVAGFKRIFSATIFFGTEKAPNGSPLFDASRFHFFDQLRLWFNSNLKVHSSAPEAYDNAITLSEAFYEEINQHRIPVEREAIACFAHAPGTLDFYIWLVWRSWIVNGHQTRIPLFGPKGLIQQLGTTEYSEDRFFRRKLQHWLRQVKIVWPQCPATISRDGQALIIASSKTAPAVQTIRR